MSSSLKSTIVRARKASMPVFFRTAEHLAPWAGGMVARDLWFTAPPRMTARGVPDGGCPFEVQVHGVTARGIAWGEGDTVVYLVHGWGGRGSQLAAYVEPLVALGYRVVLFDTPSHGDSDAGREGRGRTHGIEFGDTLAAVMERFGPAYAVVAHSLGAVSTYIGLRGGAVSTKRLVLIAPMVEATPYFDMFQQVLGFGPRTRRAFDRAIDRFVGFPIEEFDARSIAAAVPRIPTLVVHDLGDLETSPVLARQLAEGLPDARMITTTGLGHRRIVTDPEVVTQVVDFLSQSAGDLSGPDLSGMIDQKGVEASA